MSRILAGTHAVKEALMSRAAISAIYYEDTGEAPKELVKLAEQKGLRLDPRSRAELDQLAKGVRHQGIVAIAGEFQFLELEELLEQALATTERPLLVALDEITDPHNFGAIVRSAVAFGVDGIITLKDRSAPITPVVVRASAGATEHARIARVTNLARTLDALQEQYFEIVGLAAEGTATLSEIGEQRAGRVLVVGSEGRGLRRLVREKCTLLAKIPMDGPIASLNASVAAAIAIYEATQLRNG